MRRGTLRQRRFARRAFAALALPLIIAGTAFSLGFAPAGTEQIAAFGSPGVRDGCVYGVQPYQPLACVPPH